MELIPLISNILLYLIGLLVVIVVVTVISKKFKKQPPEEPVSNNVTQQFPLSIEPDGGKDPQSKKVPQIKFDDPKPIKHSGEEKREKTSSNPDLFKKSGGNRPQSITIKTKDSSADDLFKVKEEKSNARRYKPKSNRPGTNNTPRFQILNKDVDNKSEPNNEKNKNIDE